MVLIGLFSYGFYRSKEFYLDSRASITKFSVVIPFRNEAENLPQLLESIESLNYPRDLFDVILVDDDSEDESLNIIRSFINSTGTPIRVIANERKSNSPKKDAITCAIKAAKYKWIVTTDADCVLSKFWLDSLDEFIQTKRTSCIAAPVMYADEKSFLSRFQILDMLSLQGATIGGFGIKKPFLCNGANFAYKKSLFNELNGFDGNSDIASGDDVFFLEKVAKAKPNQLHYLKCKDAIVTTFSQPSIKSLLSQRVRWASKTTAYKNSFGKITGVVVLLMNGLLVSSLMLSTTGLLGKEKLLVILFIKFFIDFLLMYMAASFFGNKGVLKNCLTGFLLYPFFTIYVAVISMFSKYKWKERTFDR